eukprot:gene24759-60320_t
MLLCWFRVDAVTDPYGLYVHSVLLLMSDVVLRLVNEAEREVRDKVAQGSGAATWCLRVTQRIDDDMRVVHHRIDADNRRTEEEKDDSFRLMLGLVCGCASLLMALSAIGLSVVFVRMIVGPLVALQRDMADVAVVPSAARLSK